MRLVYRNWIGLAIPIRVYYIQYINIVNIENKSGQPSPVRVRMHTFCHDVRDEQSCMVRFASHDSGEHEWQVFAFGEVVTQRKDPLRPLITLFNEVHQRIRSLMRTNSAIDPEFLFDEVLTSFNEQWKTLFKSHDVAYLLKSSYVLGIVKGGRMCLADRGLCVGKMITRVDGRNKVVPVLSVRSTKTNSKALFESIVCGELPPLSRVILGTSQLPAIGRNDVFVQLFSKRTTSLEVIWQRIQKKLRLAGDPTMAGIMLESFVGEAPLSSTKHPGYSDYLTAPPTQHIAFLDGVSRKLFVLAQRFGMLLNFLWTRIRLLLHAIFKRLPHWMRIPTPLTKVTKATHSTLSSSVHKITEHETSRTIARSGRLFVRGMLRGILLSLLWLVLNLYRPIKRSMRWLRHTFFRLSLVQKIALLGVCAAVVGITFGIHYTRLQETRRQKQIQVSELTNRFVESFTIAESKLVFGNIPEAKAALTDAETAIATLRSLHVPVANLESQLSGVKQELLKEVPVSLSESVSSFEEPVLGMSPADNRIFVWTTQNLTDLSNDRVVVLPQTLSSSIISSSDNDMLVFLHDTSLTSYSISEDSLQTGEIDLSGVSHIVAAQLYGGRLYSVSESGSIFKHNERSNGLARGVVWSDVTFTEPSSITVDGNIYTSSHDGSMRKYFKGKLLPFDVSSIEPPLGRGTLLWTDSSSEFVYILDPSAQRIVVINKQGLMRAQYLLDRPIDSFAISETERRAYVSSGNQVFRFGLSHITN